MARRRMKGMGKKGRGGAVVNSPFEATFGMKGKGRGKGRKKGRGKRR